MVCSFANRPKFAIFRHYSAKEIMEEQKVKDSVKEFYGKRVQKSADLQTNATWTSSACAFTKVPAHVRAALKCCHKEVVSRYYGCGLVFPECLEGSHVLDLGSGSGRDCYVLSQLVGEQGFVTGVDITQEQLDIANKYKEHHAKEFGFSKPNTEFKMGDIEKLGDAGIKDNSVDIVVSNCVVNLATDKRSVLQETWRVLKDGGEVYFSDVYADRILSDEIRKHELLWGECIAGALWWRELVDLCKDIGFSGPFLVTGHQMAVKSTELAKVLGKGDAQFVSATYRLFKTARKNDKEEMFKATYKGTIPEYPDEFVFDVFSTFKTGKAGPVSATMVDILNNSRYSKYFEVSTSPIRPSTFTRDEYATADPFSWVTGSGRAADLTNEVSCCSSAKKPCCGDGVGGIQECGNQECGNQECGNQECGNQECGNQ